MKFKELTKVVFKDISSNIRYIVVSILRYISIIIVILTPFISMYLVYYTYNIRGKFAIGGECFIPILLLSIAYIISKYANHLNVGNTIPIPHKRFTKDEGNGEITIEKNRTEEIILYVYEVENYLDRHGLL